MTNMIMGPPIFAPLLFGTSAYLGLIASFLQREEGDALGRGEADNKQGWQGQPLAATPGSRTHLH